MYKYTEIAAKLEEEIYRDFSPGDKFPSEEKLRALLHVNRATIHKALEALKDKGLLELKGRGGSVVADFLETGFDNRLVVLAMPLRGHMWEKLYIELSCLITDDERFVFAVDTNDAALGKPGAEELMFSRLRRALRFRPRDFVVASESSIGEFLEKLGSARRKFKNLTWLHHDGDLTRTGDIKAGGVWVDIRAAWKTIAKNALRSGYKRFSLFVPESSPSWLALEESVRDVLEAHGVRDTKIPWFSEENLTESLETLTKFAREKEPLAVICTYDFGAHLAAKAMKTAGIDVPGEVGIYGLNNTPWSERDDLSTVGFDFPSWGSSVMECMEQLDKGVRSPLSLIPPIFIQRGSSKPVNF